MHGFIGLADRANLSTHSTPMNSIEHLKIQLVMNKFSNDFFEMSIALFQPRNLRMFYRVLIVFALSVCHCHLSRDVMAQDPFDLPRIMDATPGFEASEATTIFSKKLMPLWLEALSSDTVELQRQAAETIVLAKRRGMDGLDSAIPALLDRFQKPDVDRSVRSAIANALIAVDAKQSAIAFASVLSTASDIQLQSICETAIADWKSDCIVDVWRKRLTDPSESVTTRGLAIRGVARLGDESTKDELFDIVMNEVEPFSLRFESSKAIGQLSKIKASEIRDVRNDVFDQSIVKASATLRESDRVMDRLLGVNLVSGCPDAPTCELLLQYAGDPEPAIATIAWQGLLETSEPRRLDSKIEFGIANRDYRVRRQAIQLLAFWGNGEATKKLGQLLNDKHPDVRKLARVTLLEFAKEDALVDDVIDAADAALRMGWQGIQQGLLILCLLDHKPAAKTCLELGLLDHVRGEVHITAAWLLERLSVNETFASIRSYLEEHVTQIKSGKSGRYAESQYEAFSHLIQLLGRNQYKDLENVVIAKLIAKDMAILDYPIRPAAIWSIGKIYAGKKLPEKYVKPLIARLDDENPQNPESKYVKTMCAYTLGVTKTDAGLESLREFARKSGRNSRLGFYCLWAIKQLTNEPIPSANETKVFENRWFLRPLK